METCNWRQEARKGHLSLMLMLLFVSSFTFQISASGHRRQVSGIMVEKAYVRTAAKGMTSAAYFKTVNNSDTADTLYDVKADFTDMAMLHETFRDNGMVGMKEVDFVAVPARDSIEFKPGGYHVMLMNVKEALKTGMNVELELLFKHGGTIKVDAIVKE